MLALLALVVSALVLLGVLLAPQIVSLLAGDYTGAKRALTIHLVRIAFPGVGLLVLGAWCLGILNSHRRFLLPYAVPVLSNAAIVGALLYGWWAGDARDGRLAWYAELAAWGFVAGALLQVLAQLPTVRRLAGGVRPTLRIGANVRTVLHNFTPALVSRGAAQIGSYVDLTIATMLGTGALSAFTDAQLLYTLPVSLFGMSVSAAELPAMSSVRGSAAEVAAALRARLEAAARRIAYFVVPSAAAFLLLGDMVASVVLVGGRFTYADAVYVWAILAGSTIGLLAATLARLVSSSFYALRDARTPLRFAVVRIGLGVVLGIAAALYLPGALGIDERWGAAFLTASSGVAGWVELLLLRRAIAGRVGALRLGGGDGLLPKLWLAALLAAAAGWGVKLLVGLATPQLTGVLALLAFGAAYLGITAVAGVGEAGAVVGAVRRRLR